MEIQNNKFIFNKENSFCEKCGFKSKNPDDFNIFLIKTNNNLENTTLCSFCTKYAPSSEKEFFSYLKEKIDHSILETFRKKELSIQDKTKKGMNKSFEKGFHISRPPKGYKFSEKNLVPNKEEFKIKEIFLDFLNNNISLTGLGKKHGLTTSGIKKILKNKVYIGLIRFQGIERKGEHKPLIEKEIFEKVQEKLRKI